jgi:maltooligosyltrehalose trehalohydrolase
VGNRAKGDRLSALVPFEALKLAAGMVLLSPNIPLLFMGEEYGDEAPFQYFVSHSDPELIEAVRKGRREEFAAFQWDGGIPDPADEATFSRSKICLDLRHNGKHEILFEFYKTLVRLRKEILSLSALDKKGIEIETFEQEKVILIKRACEEDRVICIFNLDDKPTKVETTIEKGLWEKVLASASEEWGGMGSLVPESILSSGSEVIFVLDAYAFAIYRKRRDI